MAIFYTDSASFENITVTQNLTVLGTSSATFTENLIVDSNTIKLGNSQILRYAGIEFVDSGSTPISSASILYDSVRDQTIFYHNGGATSSVFLLGPETYNNLGNETYITQNRLVKGTGIEHLEDSNITDTGTLVSIVGPLSASGGITGSGFFGTASHAVSASYAPGGGGVTINNNTNNYVLTATGTANTINGESGLTYDGLTLIVSTSISADTISATGQLEGDSLLVNNTSQFDGLATFAAGLFVSNDPSIVSLAVTGSTILSGSTQVTGSLQVLGGITGSLLGTASRATSASFAISASWAPAGEQGASFPYDGTVTPAIISGSLIISGSEVNKPILVSGSIDGFSAIEIHNFDAGNNASSDFVAGSNNATDDGNYIDFGINSSTYNAGFVGAASDGYLYLTSSVGELHIGHAATTANSNIRLFTGGTTSDANTRLFISGSGRIGMGTVSPIATLHVSGGLHSINQTVMSSGSITGSGSPTITLNMHNANYFYVSASGAGTVTWAVSNVIVAPNVQAFILEYTGGAQKTNNWFTNTRWPGGVAPTLSTTGIDLLGFITDDAGANWRGALLQRNSS